MMIFFRQFSTFRVLNNSIKASNVRVRFAPSPTGTIHFGGLRTAFYNYIFARQNEGSFILRIEDTDQTRIVSGSTDDIHRILDWSGLTPDEGPKYGGSFGPYIQSERLDIYRKHIDTLLSSGKAYRCFCSPHRLELLRKYQTKNREKPRYDGKCKHLSDSEIMTKMNANEAHTVRFSLQSGVTRFEDMIFGPIETDLIGSHEGDPIILKSDKWPTYHFANVVDDHVMKISHVFRGCEWIPSTAKHIQLYDAFGWDQPVFSHLPLITMKDGSKMSKRNNQSQINSYIDKGYLPLAVLNLLTNVGGGVPKEKQDSMELWDMETLLRNFDFKKVICHPGGIDLSRLDHYNYLVLKQNWKDDPASLLNAVKQLLEQSGYTCIPDDDNLTRIIEFFIDGRITRLNDIVSDENSYLWEQPKLDIRNIHKEVQDFEDLLTKLLGIVERFDIDNKDEVMESLRSLCDQHGSKWSSFMKFIRLIVTGRESGPPVYDIFRCLGRKKLVEYLINIGNHIK